MSMRELELYIHIPFCVRKCDYCDFLSAPASSETMRRYTEALCREIEGFARAEEYEVSTVFFGGGTPSLFPPAWIGEILAAVRQRFSLREGADACEITLECNPGTADGETLAAYRALGINRLSLGLQSADNRELAVLGRIHTWEDFLKTFHQAREAGFSNINVDLMSALPGQTADSWGRTLERVLALGPEHISAYSLIIEEGTPFFERYQEDACRRAAGDACRELPSEEEERRMYGMTEEYLRRAGLVRYEISNYAKPGYECRHNIGYWRRTEYAGFGLGAASLLRERTGAPEGAADSVQARRQGTAEEDSAVFAPIRQPGSAAPGQAFVEKRLQNETDLSAYLCRGAEPSCEILTRKDQMEEFMFLGLRLTRGISEEEFQCQFGQEIGTVYGEVLRKLERQALICRSGGRVFLTPLGLDIANPVMAEFLL